MPYAHLVFTLPHSLNALYGAHTRWVIDNLFTSTARTLSEFAANPRWMGVAKGTPAFSLVLHTWTQDLAAHIHVHAVMACGVLTQDGQWQTPARKPDFVFPVRALSKVFRGKFLAALAAARKDGQIERDPQGDDAAWRQRQRRLYQNDWVVYARTLLGGPAQVLEYLSRYTHRTAIGNQRIRAVSEQGVAFSVRADDRGGKRTVRLDGAGFVRRFLLHVLPTGIKRIRHYGVLASACKGPKLAQARQALQMPAPNPAALESAGEFLRRVARIDAAQCPCCGLGRLRVVQVITAPRACPRRARARQRPRAGDRHAALGKSGWASAMVMQSPARPLGTVRALRRCGATLDATHANTITWRRPARGADPGCCVCRAPSQRLRRGNVGHNLLEQTSENLNPLVATASPAVQSNRVYPPQEEFMISDSLALRRINAIRYAAEDSPTRPFAI